MGRDPTLIGSREFYKSILVVFTVDFDKVNYGIVNFFKNEYLNWWDKIEMYAWNKVSKFYFIVNNPSKLLAIRKQREHGDRMENRWNSRSPRALRRVYEFLNLNN